MRIMRAEQRKADATAAKVQFSKNVARRIRAEAPKGNYTHQ